jgi:hypothetical protein
VSEVHAIVSGSLAPESYGLVLDEARELGLPALLPHAGAFVERGREGEGVLFYASGDPDSLASAILRLVREEHLLDELRARIPACGAPEAAEISAPRAPRGPSLPACGGARGKVRGIAEGGSRALGQALSRSTPALSVSGRAGIVRLRAASPRGRDRCAFPRQALRGRPCPGWRDLRARGGQLASTLRTRVLGSCARTGRTRACAGNPRRGAREPALTPSDVVHAQHVLLGARSLELARRAGAATVLTLHDYHPLCARATLLDPEGELCAPADAPACARCLAHLPFDPARWNARETTERARLAQRERVAFHRGAFAFSERVLVPSRSLAAAMLETGLVRPSSSCRSISLPALRAPRAGAAPRCASFLGGVLPARRACSSRR